MDDLPMGLRFSIIHRYVRRRMDERLKGQDLTGVQLGVLRRLSELEKSGMEEINQRELEKTTRVTHPTMTAIIQRLEKKGFIECRMSERDKRSKCIASTDKAKRLHRELHDDGESVFREVSEGLSEQQIASLIEITDILLSNIFKKEYSKEE